jgi:hypothetical protein
MYVSPKAAREILRGYDEKIREAESFEEAEEIRKEKENVFKVMKERGIFDSLIRFPRKNSNVMY